MNHNAYTVVAIEGTHFCLAAKIVRYNLQQDIKFYLLLIFKFMNVILDEEVRTASIIFLGIYNPCQ